MIDPTFDYQFRLILIGDSTVGKSALLRQFTDGIFAEVSDPTVGVDFYARLIQVADGTNIKLQLWDTAGQERFRSITKSYYRNSVGALLVYDICNSESFKHIHEWMSEAQRYIEPKDIEFLLVGCKLDLARGNNVSKDLGLQQFASQERFAKREISENEARTFAESKGIHFFETSAKTGFNVEECFRQISQQIYDKVSIGEYRVEEGWDGIKRGYFGRQNQCLLSPRSQNRGNVSLIEGTPIQNQCC